MIEKFQDINKARIFGIRTDLIEQFVQVLRRDRKAQVGSVIVLFAIFAGILAPELAPHDPMAQEFPLVQPPSSAHPLGTDTFGRDVLSRIMYGARISLAVGILAVLFGATLGVITGSLAGYFGGWIDDAFMRTIDVIWAFPYLLIALLLVAIFGNGFWNVVAALGIAYIDDFARITRGEVLSIREEEYLLAAKATGLSDSRILTREVFPNIVTPIIVQFTILVARAMIGEATLSFLGLGVQPTTPTWGSIIGEGRNLVIGAWWISVSAGVAIMIVVLGINLFGDALRDAFDVQDEVEG